MKGLSTERVLSIKAQNDLDRKVALVGGKELANLNANLDSSMQQSANAIASDIGTRSAESGAAGFDANVLTQLNASDLMQDRGQTRPPTNNVHKISMCEMKWMSWD